MRARQWVIAVLVVALAAGAAGYYWYEINRNRLPDGIVSTNGRLEAEQIEVATKLAGRIAEVLANEGDLVDAGAVVARMDTTELQAQLAQAKAEVRRAAQAEVQASALITQRESELKFAQVEYRRGVQLHDKGYFPTEKLDQRRSLLATAQAGQNSAIADLDAAKAAKDAAQSAVDRIQSFIDDSVLKAPRRGRVQYKLAQDGEVLPSGGRVLTLVDIADVYMTVFVPAGDAALLSVGGEARLILDPIPQYVIPGAVTFVAAEAQFTPKSVETADEREKLMFRVKVAIDHALLKKFEEKVKTGVRGVAYLRTRRATEWPEELALKLPQ
jgi:HlyD family secretion protein